MFANTNSDLLILNAQRLHTNRSLLQDASRPQRHWYWEPTPSSTQSPVTTGVQHIDRASSHRHGCEMMSDKKDACFTFIRSGVLRTRGHLEEGTPKLVGCASRAGRQVGRRWLH